jgi:phosphotransferase system IIB component
MVNTLVTHKKLKSLGIGCIAKELKSSYKVNFGLHDVMTCKKESLEVIDTSECKTVTFMEYRNRILSDKST